MPAGAQSNADAEALAQRFAPILEIKEQTTNPPCDTTGEQYLPSAVEIVLGREGIVLRGPDGAPQQAPQAGDLYGKGEEWFLDYPGSPFEPGCDYAREAIALGQGEPPVAYAHIVTQPDRPARLALQYWFFYYFNQFNDLHEGDWEMIQLVFNARTAAEALQQDPVAVGYSQHDGGERAGWNDDKLEREGDHPVVYPAAGSHANYYSSELWLGRSANEGFGCDDTTGPSRRIVPEARLVSEPAGPGAADAWLGFDGNWGQQAEGLFNAPTGPNTNKKWAAPIDWQDGLRRSSIAVPGDETLGVTVTGFFCSAVAGGSRLYADLLDSPLTASLSLLVLGLLVAGSTRLTRWSPVESHPLRAPRAAGQIMRAARRLYWRHIAVVTAIGLIFVPLAALGSAAQAGVLDLPLGSEWEFADGRGRIHFPFALLIGGAGSLLAYAFMTGATAVAVARLDEGRPVRAIEAYGALLPRWRSLLGALARAGLIVLGLFITIVGIPWAIRQAVRYVFIPQVCALEGLPAKECLARSTELVRGRWWRTAALVGLLTGIVLATGVIAGLVLLLFTPVSLPVVNFVGSLVYVVGLPYVGVALAFAYGDRAVRGPVPERAPWWRRWPAAAAARLRLRGRPA